MLQFIEALECRKTATTCRIFLVASGFSLLCHDSHVPGSTKGESVFPYQDVTLPATHLGLTYFIEIFTKTTSYLAIKRFTQHPKISPWLPQARPSSRPSTKSPPYLPVTPAHPSCLRSYYQRLKCPAQASALFLWACLIRRNGTVVIPLPLHFSPFISLSKGEQSRNERPALT